MLLVRCDERLKHLPCFSRYERVLTTYVPETKKEVKISTNIQHIILFDISINILIKGAQCPKEHW